MVFSCLHTKNKLVTLLLIAAVAMCQLSACQTSLQSNTNDIDVADNDASVLYLPDNTPYSWIRDGSYNDLSYENQQALVNSVSFSLDTYTNFNSVVTAPSGDVYVAGQTHNNEGFGCAFIIRYDEALNQTNVNEMGDFLNIASLVVSETGEVYALGWSELGNSIIKLDAQLTEISRSDDISEVTLRSMCISADQRLYICGSVQANDGRNTKGLLVEYTTELCLNNKTVWDSKLNNEFMIVKLSGDGTIYITGFAYESQVSVTEAVVLKYDKSLNLLTVTSKSEQDCYCIFTAIAVAPDNAVYVSYYYSTGVETSSYIIKLDSDLLEVSVLSMVEAYDCFPAYYPSIDIFSLEIDTAGWLYAVCQIGSYSTDADGAILLLDDDLTVRNHVVWGSDARESFVGIAIGNDLEVYIIGESNLTYSEKQVKHYNPTMAIILN